MSNTMERGTCERCGVTVIGERANPRVWARCICVGCLPPAPPLPRTPARTMRP
jgi:hypothetical protein